jgi:peptide-methionine (S)-S-oxide reductase
MTRSKPTTLHSGLNAVLSILATILLLVVPSDAHSEAPASRLAKATFAGGCFWCMQPAYDEVPGVVGTRVGYTGGKTVNPAYEAVSAGGTGHAESIEVTYDPKKISYRKLLDIFWHNVDPTTADREFCDVGRQYRTAIFFHNAEQESEAKQSRAELGKTKPFKAPIVTEIVTASTFYPAEDYHQEYYKKNPIRYRFYRYNCGRDQRLHELWGAASGAH